MKKITLIILLTQFAFQFCFSQTIPDKGLVAYYTFNGEVKDESGKNNNPVFNNITLTEDRFGNKNAAAYFNGKDNYIQIKSNSSLCPEEITLVAIVKPMGFYNGNCYNNTIIDKGYRDYLPGAYALRYTAGEYTHGDCNDGDIAHQNFVGMVSDNGGKTSGDNYVKLNTWYYVVFTYNRQYCRLYLDGEMISSYGSRSKIGKTNEDVFFGKKDNSNYPYWFNGVMDEIRIYDRCLTSEEVYTLHAQLSQSKPTASQ